MTPQTVREAENFLYEFQARAPRLNNMEVIICPPFVYLELLSEKSRRKVGTPTRASGFKIGAQDVFWEDKGSYTGEVSAVMLKNLGVKYVIVGHSERRENLFETDEVVNKKIKLALKKNLKVIFCVGEKERDADGAYLKFIKKELLEGLNKVARKDFKNLIICYEPVWAISSRKGAQVDTPKDFLEVSIYIRRALFFKFGRKAAHEIPILYGGSVDGENARSFLEEGGAQGLLVGRASQKAKTFVDLLKNIQ